MRPYILKIASKKLSLLMKNYDKFINVFVDDWRGFRFIFDTEDTRKCINDCSNCDLCALLKNEPKGYFSSGLFPANNQDKKNFGYQNFLNCKTLEQYQNCYINFLSLLKNEKEIINELQLIKKSVVLFSRNNRPIGLEKKFKNKIAYEALNNATGSKKRLISSIITSWQDFYLPKNS